MTYQVQYQKLVFDQMAFKATEGVKGSEPFRLDPDYIAALNFLEVSHPDSAGYEDLFDQLMHGEVYIVKNEEGQVVGLAAGVNYRNRDLQTHALSYLAGETPNVTRDLFAYVERNLKESGVSGIFMELYNDGFLESPDAEESNRAYVDLMTSLGFNPLKMNYDQPYNAPQYVGGVDVNNDSDDRFERGTFTLYVKTMDGVDAESILLPHMSAYIKFYDPELEHENNRELLKSLEPEPALARPHASTHKDRMEEERRWQANRDRFIRHQIPRPGAYRP